jgi:hypothetical protein
MSWKNRRVSACCLFAALIMIASLVSCSGRRDSEVELSVRMNLARQALAGCASEFEENALLYLQHQQSLESAKKKNGYTFVLNDQVFKLAGVPLGEPVQDTTLRRAEVLLLDSRTLNDQLSAFVTHVFDGLKTKPKTPEGISAQRDSTGRFRFYNGNQELSIEQVIRIFKDQILLKLTEAEKLLIAWIDRYNSRPFQEGN